MRTPLKVFPRNKQRGFVLAAVMILLLALSFTQRSLFMNTDTNVQRSQNELSIAQNEISADWALNEGIKHVEDFLNTGTQELFLGADMNGTATGSSVGGDYEDVAQIFAGNSSQGSNGLVQGDFVDVLRVGNSQWSFKPFGTSGGTVNWTKSTGSTPYNNELTFTINQSHAPASAKKRPFVTRALVRALGSSQDDTTGLITTSYQYVVASKASKFDQGSSTVSISDAQLEGYLPFESSTSNFDTLNLNPFSASNYSRVSSCFSDSVSGGTYRRDGDTKYLTGSFDMRLYPPSYHSPNTPYLPVYPPPTSSYSYNGGSTSNTPYFMSMSPNESQIILSRQGGIEIINALTGANETVNIPADLTLTPTFPGIPADNTTATAAAYRLWAQDYCGSNQKKFCMLVASGLYDNFATTTTRPWLIIVDIDPTSPGYKTYTKTNIAEDRLINLFGFPGSDNIFMVGEYDTNLSKVVVQYDVATGVSSHKLLNTIWAAGQPGVGGPTLQQWSMRVNAKNSTPKLVVHVYRNMSGTTPGATTHAFVEFDPYSATPLTPSRGPVNSSFVHTNSMHVNKHPASLAIMREIWSTVAGTNNATGRYFKLDLSVWPPAFSPEITGFYNSTMYWPTLNDDGTKLSVIQVLPDPTKTGLRRYEINGNKFEVEEELNEPMFPVNACKEHGFYFPDGHYYALCNDFKIIRVGVPSCEALASY